MPTTDPRELKILQDLQATLRMISVADGYGWNVKPSSVVLDPVNIFDLPDTALPFFIVEPTDDGDRDFHPAYQLTDDFVFVITARIDIKGDDPNARIIVGSRLYADIEKVLTVDIERSGLASDTRLRKPAIFTSMSGDQSVIVVQRGSCKLYRTFGEPG